MGPCVWCGVRAPLPCVCVCVRFVRARAPVGLAVCASCAWPWRMGTAHGRAQAVSVLQYTAAQGVDSPLLRSLAQPSDYRTLSTFALYCIQHTVRITARQHGVHSTRLLHMLLSEIYDTTRRVTMRVAVGCDRRGCCHL